MTNINKDEISQETFDNTNALNKLGAHVLFRVDATKLEKSIATCKYDTIIFQFPNVGSREAKYNRNPNHIMIRKFLKSANNYLNPTGKVMITVVENSHYYGAFDFQDAAAFAGYEILMSCAFDPAIFSDYSHQNTKDEDSALEQHKRFATWIFKLKK